ncbi:DUF1638 domain-containing protein [Kaustia mangrovi]|uniref:DUF1638 domain-containing protein n=1 Tax=Kaustia mangrovi TaxID=2593653 RepID=A0A7S8HEH4_9HYPH|nr:DUF1638 domain-containing protein [Kaustia mangrovi]QPC45403.1 DUF1638 domain-containing protein [Kaustia mangrovi]
MDLAPSQAQDFKRGRGDVLLIACGALAREIVDLIELNDWRHFDVSCLPAKWHNTPALIPEAVRAKIRAARGRYSAIYVLYGDCGTGGKLDRVLAEEGVERIGGPHCYSFFSGNEAFAEREAEDCTSFFLTDYLCRHFDKLIIEGLGIDRHPELLPLYFGNYEKIVYLAQTDDETLREKAQEAAERLGLAYEYRFTGYGDLSGFMGARSGRPSSSQR